MSGSVLDDGEEINMSNVWWKDDSSEGGSFNPIVLNETILDDENSMNSLAPLVAGHEMTPIESITGKPQYQHDTVLFSVKDNGIGIKRTDFGKLFKKFQQLDAGAGSKHSGTGLGLTICNEITRLHRGRVGFRSSGIPGEGTELLHYCSSTSCYPSSSSSN